MNFTRVIDTASKRLHPEYLTGIERHEDVPTPRR
jgi:hypothetical protein